MSPSGPWGVGLCFEDVKSGSVRAPQRGFSSSDAVHGGCRELLGGQGLHRQEVRTENSGGDVLFDRPECCGQRGNIKANGTSPDEKLCENAPECKQTLPVKGADGSNQHSENKVCFIFDLISLFFTLTSQRWYESKAKLPSDMMIQRGTISLLRLITLTADKDSSTVAPRCSNPLVPFIW